MVLLDWSVINASVIFKEKHRTFHNYMAKDELSRAKDEQNGTSITTLDVPEQNSVPTYNFKIYNAFDNIEFLEQMRQKFYTFIF